MILNRLHLKPVALVYARFPAVGLGNMLLIWARAFVVSQIKKVPYSTSSWSKVHWGALLRGESSSRFYFRVFNTYSMWRMMQVLYNFLITASPARNLSIEDASATKDEWYMYDTVVIGEKLFAGLHHYKKELKDELGRIMQTRIRSRAKTLKRIPCAMHIRRGDFLISQQATDLNYFKKIIEKMKILLGERVWMIFSDASERELEPVLSTGLAKLFSTGNDILDLLQLSQSNIIVLSKSSSFGYWGAFLGDGVVIMHPDDWQETITGGNSPEYRWGDTLIQSEKFRRDVLFHISNND